MSRVFLVHGFNVRDNGADTIDMVGPYFKFVGIDVEQFDYGWVGLLGARLFNARRAGELAKLAGADDICVGHSNGCAIIHRASNMGGKFKRAVYISPALDKDVVPGPNVEHLDVWFSKHDMATKLAIFIPWVLWGEMGSTGYIGNDPRIRNFNREEIPPYSTKHSDVFLPDKIAVFGPLIVNSILNSLENDK